MEKAAGNTEHKRQCKASEKFERSTVCSFATTIWPVDEAGQQTGDDTTGRDDTIHRNSEILKIRS